MTQKEKSISLGRNLDEWQQYIIQSMTERFKKIVRSNGEIWFEDEKGLFHIVAFESPMYGFIIEYAESNDDGAFLAAEDGDQWPLLDYETPELMLQDMLKEIEG